MSKAFFKFLPATVCGSSVKIAGTDLPNLSPTSFLYALWVIKKYGFFDTCYFYAFNGRIIKYLKERYNGRTMGYPDFQMKEFTPDIYQYYVDIGLAMNIVKSEVFPIFKDKNLPIHMFCADNESDVRLCIEKGADLITANDPVPLMKVLGRI